MEAKEEKPAYHVAVDLETLGLGFKAPIVALALVMFTEEEILGHQLYRLNWDDQPDRMVARGTLEWWVSQEPEILRNSLGAHEERMATAVALGGCWTTFQDATTVWGNPPAFDLGLLKPLFRHFLSGVPWSHRAERCGRTIRLHQDRVEAERPHDPVSDALALARQVQLASKFVGGIW